METKNLIIDFSTPNLDQVMNAEPWTNELERILYNMGKEAARAEIITMVINLLKENPNIDGLEILKKL